MLRNISLICCFLLPSFGCGDDGTHANDNNQNGNDTSQCGDGERQGAEECDEGAANSDTTPDACRTDCQLPHCGDDTVDTGEACDDGPLNSDAVPNRCRADCREPECGDGVVDDQRGERCDDANVATGDGCSPVCLPEYCGNGEADPGEDCDDGSFIPGDGCGPTCLFEICGNGFVDAASGETCDDGNLRSHDGCNSACAVEVPTWTPLSTMPPRSHHGVVYDSARGVAVLYGGMGAASSMGDTWENDGTGWRRVVTPNSPGPRRTHAMAFDSARGVTVLHGGYPCGGTACNDTWEYDGVDWSQVTTVSSPSSRHVHAMAYDSARGVSVIFGGDNTPSGFLPIKDDTWEYDGVDWVERTPITSPPGRRQHSLAYDAVRSRVVLFGGRCGTGSSPECISTTWLWDGTNWASRTQTTPPHVRLDHAMAFDAGRSIVVLYGGGYYSSDVYVPLRDTWRWNGTSWAQIAGANHPGDRQGAAMAFHAGLGGALLVDGGLPIQGDSWLFDGSAWALQTVAPAPRYNFGFAFDEARGVAVLFGGAAPSISFADTWELDRDAWVERHPAHSPSSRRLVAMAGEGANGRVILFGGVLAGTGEETNETWSWDGYDWTLVSSAHSPSARMAPALAYDGGRDRLVLFGGLASGAPDTYLADTWEFDGVDWMEVVTPQSPPGRRFAGLAPFSSTGRLMLVGGEEEAGDVLAPWEYDGTTWTPVTVAGPAPEPTYSAGIAALEATSTILFFGGGAGFNVPANDDTWGLGPFGWVELSPTLSPDPRNAGGCLVEDPVRRRVLLFGGGFAFAPFGDTWTFQYQSSLPDERCENGSDDDQDTLVDCADPDCDGLPCDAGTCQGGLCL